MPFTGHGGSSPPSDTHRSTRSRRSQTCGSCDSRAKGPAGHALVTSPRTALLCLALSGAGSTPRMSAATLSAASADLPNHLPRAPLRCLRRQQTRWLRRSDARYGTAPRGGCTFPPERLRATAVPLSHDRGEHESRHNECFPAGCTRGAPLACAVFRTRPLPRRPDGSAGSFATRPRLWTAVRARIPWLVTLKPGCATAGVDLRCCPASNRAKTRGGRSRIETTRRDHLRLRKDLRSSFSSGIRGDRGRCQPPSASRPARLTR